MRPIQNLLDKYESQLGRVESLMDARQLFISQFIGETNTPMELGWLPGETARRVGDAIIELASLRQQQKLLQEITADLRNL